MDTKKALRLARKHIGKGSMESSARLALSDAVELESIGDLDHARRRALVSRDYVETLRIEPRCELPGLMDFIKS